MAKDDKPQDKKLDAPVAIATTAATAPESAPAPQGLPAIGETVHVCVMDGGVLVNEHGYPYPMEAFDVQVSAYVRRCIERGDLIRL